MTSTPSSPGDGRPSGTTLADLHPGGTGRVRAVLPGPLRNRLLELGLVPGTLVRLVRLAPVGDPLEVVLHGFHLAIRRADAARVELDVGA